MENARIGTEPLVPYSQRLRCLASLHSLPGVLEDFSAPLTSTAAYHRLGQVQQVHYPRAPCIPNEVSVAGTTSVCAVQCCRILNYMSYAELEGLLTCDLHIHA